MRLPRFLNTTRPLQTAAVVGWCACLGLLVGCDVPSFIDPGELAGLRSNAREPLVVKILDDLDPALEQENRQFATAELPRPEDLVTEPSDYVVGAGDLLQITIYDLEGPGLQTIKNTRVSGTGNITLPYLNNVVRGEGLTEIELQQAVADGYRQGGVLDQANVSVSVLEQRNRAYSVLGGVARPNVYVITDEDFRLLDALTSAGDIQNPFIEDVYIFRRPERKHGAGDGGAGMPETEPAGGTTQPADDLAPPQSNSRKQPKELTRTVLLQDQGPADSLAPDGTDADASAAPDAAPAVEIDAAEGDPGARVGRVDGQEVIVQPRDDAGIDDPAEAQPGEDMPPPGAGEPFAFNDLPAQDDVRVIRVPLAKLRNGDWSYNVAIRPRDIVYVPPGQIGFYYMHGHIVTTGAYAFQGQKVTLTQAIAAARGLDGLAIPQRTDIIRRIGPNEQMFYRVDLARIFAGKSPDIYLKPNDTVAVGTNFLAPFLAAIRGGFRMTYGFGFLYDRNFAYDQTDQRR